MDYGFYYAWKANKGILSAAGRNDLEKGFQQMGEVPQRTQRHILLIGRQDAEKFLALHATAKECLTPSVEHLYRNTAELALERRNIPPDVEDYAHFLEMLSPAARQEYKSGFENQPTPEMQKQLQAVKRGCLAFTKGAAESMEGFCRCQADAAKESKLGTNDLDALGAHFRQAMLTDLSHKYPVYEQRKKACYH